MPVPRYRGIENPFGHILKFLEGVNIIISANIDNGGNGLSKVYVCDDLTKFSNTSVDDYTYIGNLARTEGYIKTLIFGENGCIFTESVGGTSNYPIGDGCATRIPDSGKTLNEILIGGNSVHGNMGGIFLNYSNNAPSYKYSYIGTRLCYVKNNLKIETL